MTEKVKLFGVSWKDLLAVWREGAMVIFLLGPHRVQHTCETEQAAEEYASVLAREWQGALERDAKRHTRQSKFMERMAKYLKRITDEMDDGEEWKKNDDD